MEYRNRATLVGGTGAWHVISLNAEYTNNDIAVFVFKDGLISAYHDYFDPRRFQVVVDALPAG